MFDVAIIVAGPAGTAAAFDLLTKGFKVLILDKYEFPRKKACAGGITPKAYHLFRYDISSVIKRECRTVRINPSKGEIFYITDENTLCYMTRRKDLDLFSLNKVIEKGGDFRVAKKIQAIKGYPLCTGGFNYRPRSKRILLAGDAAGLAERLLGEGIFFAIKSGQMAAQSILESEEVSLSAGILYLKKLKKIQMDLRFHEFSSKWLYMFPHVSLKALSFPFVHKRFVKGYADGKTIIQILYGKAAEKKGR